MKALDLPEIRFRVCCFLDDVDLARLALVSSDWYHASRQLLWYHPKLRGRTSREIRSLLAPQPSETIAFPRRPVGPQVKSLGFLSAKLANPRKDILYCVEQCPNIVSLDLTGQPHRLRLVARIVERRPGIRRIRLRGYPSPPPTKRPLAVDEDDEPLAGAATGTAIAGSTDEEGGIHMEMVDSGTTTITTTVPQHQHQHQHHPNKKRRRERKSEEDVFEILKRLKSLQTLSLWTFSVSVEQIVSFAHQARQSLVSLHLFPAKGVSDEALLAIGSSFPHLQALSLAVESSVPYRDIEAGGTVTPTLTPEGLFSLSAASSPLLSQPPPPPTTADGLVRFFRECLTESLQAVSLPRSKMTDEALRVLIARNKGLKTLQVPSCPLLTAHGLRHILDHAERLETLDYSRIQLFKWASLLPALQLALEEHLGLSIAQGLDSSTGGGVGTPSLTEQDLRSEVLKVVFGLPLWTGCSHLQNLDLSSHCFFVQPPPQQQQQQQQPGDTSPPVLNTAFFALPTSSFALCAWPGQAAHEDTSQWILAQLQQLTHLRDLRMDMIPWFPTSSEIERFAALPHLEYLNLGAIHGLEDPRLGDGNLLGPCGSVVAGQGGASGRSANHARRRRRRRSIWGQDQGPHRHALEDHHHHQQQQQQHNLESSDDGGPHMLSGEPGNDRILHAGIEEEQDEFLRETDDEEDDDDEEEEEEEEEVDEEAEAAACEMALSTSKQVVDQFLEALPRLKVLELPYRPQAVRTRAFQTYIQQQRPGFRFG